MLITKLTNDAKNVHSVKYLVESTKYFVSVSKHISYFK